MTEDDLRERDAMDWSTWYHDSGRQCSVQRVCGAEASWKIRWEHAAHIEGNVWRYCDDHKRGAAERWGVSAEVVPA